MKILWNFHYLAIPATDVLACSTNSRYASQMKKLFIALWLCGCAGAVAEERSFVFDMPTLYPRTYAMWQSMAVPYDLPDWLHSLQGTASPIRDVTVNGQPMKFGTICKSHDCGDNFAGLLFSQDRIAAVASIRGSDYVIIGKVSLAESACIERFIGNDRTTKCP